VTITFRVPGDCVPWARAGGRGTRHFTPTRQRNYMGAVKDLAMRAMGDRAPLDGPLVMKAMFVYAWPASMSARKRGLPGAAFKISTPDVDNLAKLIKDAIKGVVWVDDARVCDLHIWKRYGDRPGVTVTVEAAT